MLVGLGNGGQEPVVTRYMLTEADIAGPFGDLPDGMEAMAELEAAHYESAAEVLAEKFHMSQELLRALNPGIDVAAAGASVTVARIRAAPIEGAVARIERDTPHCSAASAATASMPSSRDTSFDGTTVASVEPSATVTTKSKAFSLASDRLPTARSTSIHRQGRRQR